MGHRLSKPALATDAVFSIMSACWSPDRPTFRSLSGTFGMVESDTGVRVPEEQMRAEGYRVLRIDDSSFTRRDVPSPDAEINIEVSGSRRNSSV